MKKVYVLAFIAAIIFAWSCSTESTEEAEPLNPNGDSELALLMRAMFNDGMKMKEQILRNELPSTDVNFERIISATPTDPEQTGTETFKTFAKVYMESMKTLLGGDKKMSAENYGAMVNTCMSCHSVICPGPTVKIKKMLLEE